MAVHIVVVGCGRVGSSLAVELVAQGHTVAIIDKNENAFRRLPPGWGGREIHGMGFDRSTLEAAGTREAGALAAVTNGDNSNILCARIARENYGIVAAVARIYDPRRAQIYQRLGIPTVATVTWTMEQVQRRLFPERSVSEWIDPSGQVEIVERLLPLAWCGRRLELMDSDAVKVVAVTRGGVAQLETASVVGQEGDIVHVAISRNAREHLEEFLAKGPVEAPQRGGHR